MLPNTYDVPAYKFALVKFDDDILEKNMDVNYCANYVVNNHNDCHFIPFESFDGLTIEELKTLFRQNHNNFYFVCYSSFGYEESNGAKVFKNTILFSLLNTGCRESQTIDEIIRNYMLGTYLNQNAQTQRVFRCFLERYCYRSQDEVSKIIR